MFVAYRVALRFDQLWNSAKRCFFCTLQEVEPPAQTIGLLCFLEHEQANHITID